MGLSSLPGQQQAELGPAKVQGWSQESNCLPTDLDIKKKSQPVPPEGRIYDIQFYVLFEKQTFIFVENVGMHYVFHLFGLAFFLGSFSSKSVLCVCCLLLFPLMEICSELSAKMGIVNTSK